MDFTKTHQFISPISYSLILATDERAGMGLNNGLPWKGHLDNKSDMKWFKDTTMGKIVVMGYNTWVSIGSKPLPGRINVIITKDHEKEVEKDIAASFKAFHDKPDNKGKNPLPIFVAGNPTIVVEMIKAGIGNWHHGGEVIVIGGAKIYEAFIQWSSRIYLTTFEGEWEADTFVKLDLTDWKLRYLNTLSYLDPKFEVWDCTEKAGERPDSETVKIEYGHQPAKSQIADIFNEMAKKKKSNE